MNIVELQEKYGFRAVELPCLREMSFLGDIKHLSLFRSPIFVVFVKIEFQGSTGEIKNEEYLTALYLDSPGCFNFPETINEATHIYVANDFNVTEDKSKIYFQRLAHCPQLTFKDPIIDPFKEVS